MLGLVLIISDCGFIAECGVNKSVNTSTVYICTFGETKSLCKNAKCDAYGIFLHKQSQMASRKSERSLIF